MQGSVTQQTQPTYAHMHVHDDEVLGGEGYQGGGQDFGKGTLHSCLGYRKKSLPPQSLETERMPAPPALVEMLPPMQQLPLAPRSRGIVKPLAETYSSSVCKIQPAWATRAPFA